MRKTGHICPFFAESRTMALSFDRLDQEMPTSSLGDVTPLNLGIDFGSNAARQLQLADAGLTQSDGPGLLSGALTATDQKPVDPFTKKMDDELGPLLTNLEGAKKDKGRQEAALAVSQWTRANMVDQDAVQRYLARTDISMEEKTATMGQLAVESARSEFLSGWSYEGGVNNGGKDGMENAGGNLGAYPSYYQNQVRTYGRDKGAEWCTSFAGSAHKSVGLQTNPGVNADEANSPFWSGYRLNNWAQTGQSNSGKQLTPTDQRVGAGQNGSRYVGNSTFAGLTGSLNKAKDDKGKAAAATAFNAKNGVPQAGDVMVLGNNNDYRGNSKSHTVMVDRYDPENQVIYTIEGNANNAIGSRRIDLKNPTDAASIVSSVRMGADKYMNPEAQARIAKEQKTNPSAEPVTAESLLGRARAVNARLSGSASKSGFINGNDPNAPAYTWQHGDNTNGQISTH